MSDCSFCGNRPTFKCALSPDYNTADNFINNIPSFRQRVCSISVNRYCYEKVSDKSKQFILNHGRLRGQVFGLPLPSKHPPFFRKKLNDREVREGIDKHELWLYVPPWQIPRIGTKHDRIGCYPFIHHDIPMKKIICMAKRNKTLEGRIGKLKFVFSHFGKRELERTSEKTKTLPKHPNINKMKERKNRTKMEELDILEMKYMARQLEMKKEDEKQNRRDIATSYT